jgi:hypothetical protein
MADTLPTLESLIKINTVGALDLGISDLSNNAPLLKVLYAQTATHGTQHKYIKLTTAPSVGFREINQGLNRTPANEDIVSVDLKYMDADVLVDIASAGGYIKGEEAYIARYVKYHLQAALFKAEQQIINGGAAEFDGFAEIVTHGNTMAINATGSTSSTGSSVYLLRTGEEAVSALVGNSGDFKVGETSTIQATASGKTFAAYLTPVGGYLGLQAGSVYDIARIYNLTAQENKGLNDARIFEAVNAFKPGLPPDTIVMGRRSYEQLRKSRTATNGTGEAAPLPSTVAGMKIVVTDAITATEAILS